MKIKNAVVDYLKDMGQPLLTLCMWALVIGGICLCIAVAQRSIEKATPVIKHSAAKIAVDWEATKDSIRNNEIILDKSK